MDTRCAVCVCIAWVYVARRPTLITEHCTTNHVKITGHSVPAVAAIKRTLMKLARASGDRKEQPPKRTARNDAHNLCMHASMSSVKVMTPVTSTVRSWRHPSHSAANPSGLNTCIRD